MATAMGRARSARAALISTLAIVALAASAGGAAAAPPEQLSVDQASLDFGSVTIGTTSATQTLTVTAGRKDVVFQAATSNGQYAIAPTGSCTTGGYVLAANASCTIDLTFAPLFTGSLPEMLTLDSCMKWEMNIATGVPHCLRIKDSVTVSLSGSGIDP